MEQLEIQEYQRYSSFLEGIRKPILFLIISSYSGQENRPIMEHFGSQNFPRRPQEEKSFTVFVIISECLEFVGRVVLTINASIINCLFAL